MTRNIVTAVILTVAFPLTAIAVEAQHETAAKATRGSAQLAEGDGPLQNFDMPAMTMVFRVKDPAMLEQVKTGDKVKFEAQKLSGAFTITRIELVK